MVWRWRIERVQIDKMKYIQFHPTALYEPNNSQCVLNYRSDSRIWSSYIESKMERFVFQYHPDGELATRDI